MTWSGSVHVEIQCDGEEHLADRWPETKLLEDGRIVGCHVSYVHSEPVSLAGRPIGDTHTTLRELHAATREGAHLAGWRKLDGVDLCPACLRVAAHAPIGGVP